MGLIRLLILNEHQRFKWRGSKNPHQKRHVFERDWTMCLKFVTCSRSIENTIGGPIKRMRIFALIMNMIFI